MVTIEGVKYYSLTEIKEALAKGASKISNDAFEEDTMFGMATLLYGALIGGEVFRVLTKGEE